ncbi:MAG: TonB-dependent receptor [Rhodospirillaceae bacterium]|nr:TonB-dependent receptor [Rhodospirillaceae bacterium]
MLGGYAFNEDQVSDRSIQFFDIDLVGTYDLLVDAQIQNLDRTGYALFGDLIWRPTDWLELSAGLRYADESVDSNAKLDFALTEGGIDLIKVVASPQGSIDDSNLSPTASVRVNLTEDISAYARYAQGFRAGGFPLAPASPISNVPFESETSDNYEVGMNGALLDSALEFDVSLFLIRIDDQQLTTIVFFNDDPNLPIASVGNAGESESAGFEAVFTVRPNRYLEVTASIGHTDAKYTDYLDTVGADRSGEAYPFVPRWTVQIGANLAFPVGDGGELALQAQWRQIDNILSGSGVDIDLQFPVDSYDVLDFRASYIRERLQLDVFVDNARDEYYETRVFNAFFFAEPRPFSIVGPPRRVGARLTYYL